MRDSTLQWRGTGPNCRKDESVRGTLSLLPPVDVSRNEQETGWISRPEPVAVAFISGILNYLDIPFQNDAHAEA